MKKLTNQIKNSLKLINYKEGKRIKILLVAVILMIIIDITFYSTYLDKKQQNNSQNVSNNEVQVKEEFYTEYQASNPLVHKGFGTVHISELGINGNNDEILYPKLPLEEEIQRYAQTLAEEKDIPVSLVYSIMYVESRFDTNAVSDTQDGGLLQVNQNTARWIADELNYEEYDLHNPYTNIEFAIWYLDYLNQYWTNQGASEDEKAFLVPLSYHKGIQGSRDWIKEYGWNSKYVDAIYDYKERLEVGEFN